MKQIYLIFSVVCSAFFVMSAKTSINFGQGECFAQPYSEAKCIESIKSNKSVLAIGHRGFCGKYTENSLQAFEQAVKLGVDGVELDVWVCKTGELVVYHDRTLERLTSATGVISDKTFAELRKLKLPNWEQIPTLSECLDRIQHKCIVNIELKGPNTAAPTARIVRSYLRKGWQAKNFMVSSFNHPELQKFHSLMPAIQFGPLTEGVMVGYAKSAQAMGANYLVINFENVSKFLVNDAHQRGLKIFVYTVNDASDIAQMKRLGIDGIITDFPNLVMQTRVKK